MMPPLNFLSRVARRAWIPLPVQNGWQVAPVFPDMQPVRRQALIQELQRAFPEWSQLGHAFNDRGVQMEPIDLIQNHHIERRRGSAFLPESMNVDIGVVAAPVCESMDQ